MHKIAYGTAMLAAILILAGMIVRSQWTTTALPAAQAHANDNVDVRALESSIDINSLPVLETPSP